MESAIAGVCLFSDLFLVACLVFFPVCGFFVLGLRLGRRKKVNQKSTAKVSAAQAELAVVVV
jgi:hypothetical protein